MFKRTEGNRVCKISGSKALNTGGREIFLYTNIFNDHEKNNGNLSLLLSVMNKANEIYKQYWANNATL